MVPCLSLLLRRQPNKIKKIKKINKSTVLQCSKSCNKLRGLFDKRKKISLYNQTGHTQFLVSG